MPAALSSLRERGSAALSGSSTGGPGASAVPPIPPSAAAEGRRPSQEGGRRPSQEGGRRPSQEGKVRTCLLHTEAHVYDGQQSRHTDRERETTMADYIGLSAWYHI